MRTLVLALLAGGFFLGAQGRNQEVPKVEKKLWAGISINEPIFFENEVRASLVIHFAVVNDGDKTVDPEFSKTQLLVNGQKLERWMRRGPGLIPDNWEALPPGQHLFKTYSLGDEFTKPGVYRVSWKGKSFQTPEIVFRVLPGSDK